MGSIKINAQLKQSTILTAQLREALAILVMPIHDLALWLQTQIEQNPALQYSDEISSRSTPFIDDLPAPPISLRDHLLAQAREAQVDLETLIDSLDEKGFIDTDHPLLPILQSFDPPGIGARNLRECLLLQLQRKNLQNTSAYRLIHDHYDDFIHSRLNSASLKEAIALLSILSLNPAAPFRSHTTIAQTPDIFIDTRGTITLNDSLLPKFSVDHSPDLGKFLKAALWLEKMMNRRSEMILSITQTVLTVQNDFIFSKTSDLSPLSFKDLAKKLSVHESTISRAVKDKIVSCPRGIYPLRFFLPHSTTESISHHTAKERLKTLIDRENKKKPLSDQDLSQALHAQGIPCARRTVTKYRKSLNIPAASDRKLFLRNERE